MSSGIAGFKARLDGLKAAVSPLTGQFVSLVGAIVGLRAGKAAIAAAEKQVQAEQRVLAALEGNRDELERIKKVTADLQKVTIFGDEALLEQAATLKEMGVSATDLDRALLAAVNTASALHAPIDLVVQAIGQFGSGKIGLLGRRLPELQQLAEQGRVAAEGIDFLNKKFEGRAASTAATDFGKAAQKSNELGDAAEQAGKILIRLKNAVLEALVPAVEKLNSVLTSPAGQTFVEVLGVILSKLVLMLPIIVAILAAQKAIQIGAFLAPIVAISAQLVIIGGIVAGVVALVLEIFGLLKPVTSFLGSAVDRVKELFDSVRRGDTDVKTLFDRFVTRVKQIATLVHAFVINPFVQGVIAIKEIFVGAAKFILGKATSLGGAIATALGQPLKTVVAIIAAAIDTVTSKAADLLDGIAEFAGPFEDEIAGLAESLRTNFAGAVADLDIGEALEKAGAQLVAEGEQRFKDALPNAVRNITQTIIDADRETEEAEKAFVQRAVDRAESKKEAEVKAARESADEKLRIDLALGIKEVQLRDRLAEIETNSNREVQERIAKRRADELKKAFDAEKVSLDELLKEREARELEPLRERLRLANELSAQEANQLDALRELGAEQQRIVDQQMRLVQVRLDEQNAVQDLIEKEAELNAVREDGLKTQQERAEKAAQFAADRIIAIREQLDKRIEEISSAREGGFILGSTALEQTIQATDEFRRKIEELVAAFEALAVANPSPEIDALREKLKAATSNVPSPTQTGDDPNQVFSGFTAGIEQATSGLDEFRELGFAAGQEVASSIGDLATSFLDADFNFAEFGKNFLKTIAKMIIQLLVFKALKQAFGFNEGGPAESGGNPVQRARGGVIPGPNVDRDIIPAVLTPGEWVIRRRSAEYYGPGIMDALNRMILPRGIFSGLGLPGGGAINLSGRFAGGGEVPVGGGDLGRGAATPVIVADNQTISRLLAGGSDAVLRFIRTNRDSIRSILGAPRT